MSGLGFGYQQTQVMGKDEWLTPPEIIKVLGPFDLDPCAPINPPWSTATNKFTRENDGLLQEWSGRVWLNPPYGDECWKWLHRLSLHKNGIALIFARTGAQGFHREVWNKAKCLLFIRKRIHFYDVNGVRAKHNGGGDSVFVAYDESNSKVLMECSIQGKRITL